MELNYDTYIKTNQVIDSIGKKHDENDNFVRLVRRLETIENQLSNDQRINMMEKNDFYYLSNELRTIRQELHQYSQSEILNYKKREDEMSQQANRDLTEMLKKENMSEMSLRQFTENFLNTWNKILIDLISLQWNRSQEWWLQLSEISRLLFHIFTRADRLLYVGCGFILISFFVYFIFVTS